jgi:acyl-CoA synthetase (AMP-forming)/AMP-acid ligase II
MNEGKVSTPVKPLSTFERDWGNVAFLPDSTLTFPAVFARRCASDPRGDAFVDVSVDRAEVVGTAVTRADVAARTRAAAAALVRTGIVPGDRVLLCVSQTTSFLSFFLAAQALGAIPVPLPSPGEFRARSAFGERVQAVAADCTPRAIVVDGAGEAADLKDAAATARVVLASDLGSSAFEGPATLDFDRSFDEVAFVQYTSGSTGSPKGVVVTHYGLVANMRAIAEAARLGPDDRLFNWLPLYHDMGLVGGFLIGLYLGLAIFVMPTRIFVGRPDSWLRGMSRFRATLSCAPNFAFSMIARRLPEAALTGLDLSSWRLAFNGAEPIDQATVEEFMRRFGAVGLTAGTMFPVYGMAECTLAAAFPVPRAAPRYDVVDRAELARTRRAVKVDPASPNAVSFISVGRAMPGHTIRILEPGAELEVDEGHVGEIVVSGPSISPYYFRKDADHPAPRSELRTGDLGYLSEGQLYIVDRLKDLLIVGGRNIVPSDVERVCARVPGVRYGSVVAFALRGAHGTDDLCVVLSAEPKADPERVKQEVQTAVLNHFAVAPRDVVLVTPSAIPKTSSGKIQRAACRDLYERGAFSSEDESAPA